MCCFRFIAPYFLRHKQHPRILPHALLPPRHAHPARPRPLFRLRDRLTGAESGPGKRLQPAGIEPVPPGRPDFADAVQRERRERRGREVEERVPEVGGEEQGID